MPVDYLHKKSPRSALSIAAKKGLLLIAEMLLYHGPSPNSAEPNGKTPLDYAKENGHSDCVYEMEQYLLNVGQTVASVAPITLVDDDAAARMKAFQEFQLTAYLATKPFNPIDHDPISSLV